MSDLPKLRLFFVSEGPTELGREESYDGKQKAVEGALMIFCKKVLDGRATIEVGGRKSFRTLKSLPTPDESSLLNTCKAWLSSLGKADREMSKAILRKSLWACYEAEICGCDAVVLVVDQDQENSRDQALSELSALRPSASSIRLVCALAIETFDVWLLADPDAFSKAFGTPLASLPQGIKPERWWGDTHQPTSNHPRNILTRSLQAIGAEVGVVAFRALAESTDVSVLERVCPRGFGTLAQRLRGLLAPPASDTEAL